MKISFVKYEKESNYQIQKLLGMKVEEIQEPEEIKNKYKNDNKLNIIITP